MNGSCRLKLSRTVKSAAAILCMGWALASPQTEPGDQLRPAPDKDARAGRANALTQPQAGIQVNTAQQQAIDALSASVKDLNVRWSSLTGSPSRLYSLSEPLTASSTATPQEIASGFLAQHLTLLSLSDADVSEVRVSRNYVTPSNGVTHLTLQQQARSLDIFGAVLNMNVDVAGRLLNVGGEFIPGLSASLNTDTPSITSSAAVEAAAADAGVLLMRAAPSPALVYFPMGQGSVRLAWDMTIDDGRSPNMYRTLVDAVDGTVLWRQNLTWYSHVPAHGPVFTSDSPSPNTPTGTGAGQIPRVDSPFGGLGFFPHADPHADWWNGSGLARDTTRSNNVRAKNDRDNDNDDSEGFPPAVLGEDFTFALGSPIDQTANPSTYTDAATVNLFFWNNRVHDLFYRLGFDEASGNFQSDNFGLGGSGGDPVQADSQDDAADPNGARCNANFGTPGDGSSPRMQMYVCGNQDGDFDNDVIIHEYTHGVHSRLVPTMTGSQGGMGEGFGDFFAMSFLSAPGDDLRLNWKIGRWLFFPNGIRRQPYSTNQTVFTRTYADIVDGSACTGKVCSNDPTDSCTQDSDCGMGNTCDGRGCSFDFQCKPPVTSIDQGTCVAEVHNTGEIWSNTLWMARANFVWKYGFSVGSQTLMQDVIDGMKLAAPMPTFLDMRDGVLMADLANNGGVNQCLLWDAFARMGLGVSAVTTGPTDINPLEAFDTPAACTPNIEVSGSQDFGNVCRGSSLDRTLTVSNSGSGELIVTSINRISGSSDITIAPNPTLPAVITGGSQLDFTITCDPTTLGLKTAVFRISSNDPDQPTIDLTYTCNVPPGDVRVTGSTTFGDVCAGSVAEKTVSVCNVGLCDLNVTSVAFEPPCADFTLVNNPFPAPVSHDSCNDLVIRFTPTSAGPKSCTLVIRTDDPDSPAVSLIVTANTPAAMIDVPPDQSFPATVIQSVGSCTSGQPFPVSNTGTCPLHITNMAVTTNPAEFSQSGLPSFPIILEPGHIAGEGDLNNVFAPAALDRDLLGVVTVTFVSDPILGTTTDVTRNLCGEGTRTGARVLVTAGGVPLALVEKIQLQRINANRNKNILDTNDVARKVALQTVTPASPCAPFQFHREYGAVGNPIQLLPGSYQVTVTAIVNGKRMNKTVGFSLDTCGFNANIVVNF